MLMSDLVKPHDTRWPNNETTLKVQSLLDSLPPLPWRVHADPLTPERYYISGPPGTSIIMEGLQESDAFSIVSLFNNLPDVFNFWEDVAQLWEGESSGNDPTYTTLKLFRRMQMELAKFQGTNAIVPLASTAADLNILHVGSYVSIAGSPTPMRIRNVERGGDGGEMTIVTTEGSTYLYLTSDTTVEVTPPDGFAVAASSEDETPEGQPTADEESPDTPAIP